MVGPRVGPWLVSVVLVAGLGSCGGGGGGGEGGAPSPLPLLLQDEVVSPMTAGTTSNEIYSCHAGDRVYVVWVERSNVVPDAVWFDRSLDAGATWLPAPVPVSDPQLESGAAAVACDGDRVYVAYRSFVSGHSEIRLNRSLDAGTTFLPSDVTVSDLVGQTGLGGTAVCCTGTNVHVAWADDRDGLRDVYYHRSTDAGASFPGLDLRLESDVPGATDSREVHLACDASHVYAAWIDLRAGPDDGEIRLNRSVDGGATFLAQDVKVSHAPAATGDNLSGPAIVSAGDAVTMVWTDGRNGLADVFANRSLDGGLTFLPTDTRVDSDAPGSHASARPVACRSGSDLHVAWSETVPNPFAARYRVSHDLGATFVEAEIPLPVVTVEGGARDLAVACEGPTVVVAWESSPNGPGQPDILVAASTDGGATFEGTRADTDPPNASLSFNPSLSLTPGHVVVIWADVRAPGVDGDVRVNRTAP